MFVNVIFVISVMLLLSIFASRLSERYGIPSLLLFLGLGMLAGSDGPGGIYFDDSLLASRISAISLSYILFSGALETRWTSVKTVLARGLLLSTAGVLMTAAATAVFAYYVLHFSLQLSLLLGAIVSSTDAAAVFSILRSKSVGLAGELKPLLEFESGSNDPMAVIMTLTLVTAFAESTLSLPRVLGEFCVQIIAGGAVGLCMGKISVMLLRTVRLDYEGLYPVLTISLVMLIYSFTEIIQGNGYLAVYFAGLMIGNSEFVYKRSLVRFHDGLAWMMQIVMFLMLGLLVFPSRLPAVTADGLAISVFLIFISRPLAVLVCLIKSRFTYRQRLLAAWAGLRGSVAVVLATFPMIAGIGGSERIFNIVFFVVLTSMIVQGKFLIPMAKLLGVYVPMKRKTRYPLEFERTADMESETREYEISAQSPAAGMKILNMNLPGETLVLLVRRDNKFIVPRGQTVIKPYDTLLVMATDGNFRVIDQLLNDEK